MPVKPMFFKNPYDAPPKREALFAVVLFRKCLFIIIKDVCENGSDADKLTAVRELTVLTGLFADDLDNAVELRIVRADGEACVEIEAEGQVVGR